MQVSIKPNASHGIEINQDNENVDISVILLFHNEGSLVHRTLRGLEVCLAYTFEQGLQAETVVVLDRVTDKRLRETIFGWEGKLGYCQVFHTDYGSPALARNYGIANSRGSFIALLDGDDLFCKDWLVKAFRSCRATGGIAHPEVCYYFPTDNHLFINQDKLEYRTLIHHNLWSVLVMAHRSIFQEIPYRPDTKGFGFEDWLWNCETTAKGFSHVVVRQTVIAVRQKDPRESLCQYSSMNNLVVAPNALFKAILSEPYFRGNRDDSGGLQSHFCATLGEKAVSLLRMNRAKPTGAQTSETDPNSSKNEANLARLFYWRLRSILFHESLRPIRDKLSPQFRRAIKEMLRLTREVILIPLRFARYAAAPNRHEKSWIRVKLLELAEIEPELRFFGPLRKNAPKSRIYECVTPAMGALLQVKKARVFILPWLIKGGADLVALNYMNAVNQNVFLITTSPASNAFLDFLPSGAVHIDLGNTALFHEERALLLHRLLLEADCEFIHVINSREAFDIFVKYHHTFAGSRIFASFFAVELAQGFELGYAVEHFPRLLDFFGRISTDNRRFKKRLEELYGLPKDLIEVHRMPFSPPHFNMKSRNWDPSDRFGQERVAESPLRVFYAGRLAPEKRPEIAIKAVEVLLRSGEKILLDVWGESCPNFRVKFPRAPGIKFRGKFDGIASVDPTQYDVMILPSESEGLPNVLIECMGNGVPVIASNVGGVSEIVTNETGWLVDDHSNPAAFQTVLKSLVHNRQSIKEKGLAAREFVIKHHSWQGFQAQVREFYWPRRQLL